jgi:hypothetical protein
MNDDEFSGFISSGKHHTVTVSERTGNAKTPKNIVSSNEEETQLKVHTFEEKEGKFDPLSFDAKAEANLRLDKISEGSPADSQNRQALSENPPVENLQEIDQDFLQVNKQEIPQELSESKNLQNVQTGNIQDNRQGIATDKFLDNTQGLGSGNLEDNRQSIATDKFLDNTQGLGSGNLEDNRQGIATDKFLDNTQGLGSGNLEDNRQGIATDKFLDNTQGLGSGHFQDNRQGLPTEHLNDNIQGIAQDPPQSNNAGIAKENIEDNLKYTAEKVSISDNLQAVSQNPILTHFEALPPTGQPLRDASISSQESVASSTKTADASMHLRSKRPPPTTRLASSTSEANRVALVQQEQAEAFHRRLTDIKHNVDELNHKLDDFENKS